MNKKINNGLPRRLAKAALFGAVASFALVAGWTSSANAADEIVIGASLPLSGPLAGFGSFQQWGYKRAIDAVNKAGGIAIDGKKWPVRLIIRDDKTDPNASASNIETLISRDNVTALLGSCTPSLVNAGALVAERHKKPMVTGCDPLEAFKSVRKWTYVWDLFFDEPDLAGADFKMIAEYGIETNKKVAILHDNGPDGQIVGGQIWPAMAKAGGMEVVENASFPIDNTQFTSIIAEAKSKNAEIVLVDSITPQAVSIRKQMASAGFSPKILVIEKGAEPVQFAEALGKLSDGILVGGYWDPSFPYPGAAQLAADFEKETGQTSSQHIADSNSAAEILLDAIAAAGSTDPEKINAAIAKTDKTYVAGLIKFDENHTSKLPMAIDQWQSGKAIVVWPKDRATGKLLFPMPN
ncbi:amino acid ABC transporter substrate-binding protein [Methylocapsa sp. S129]|uniref:amino acid ABC transporter substrate-binding protein n=1 Tax=Methylocapsa sp. S129 TaxID=1641869 RepID=UPI00131A7DCD|nr:amino acid ABC transporter substrate-binding protein [Methylocapsa sp. S129]